MSYREELEKAPEQFDLLAVLRWFERTYQDKPRIGESSVVSEDIAELSQSPYLEFPGSNVTAYETTVRKRPRISSRFLGFFGPQGALPLSTTIETYNWSRSKDVSFERFTNIFANRFLQLFFRTWSNARPITQHDRPPEDRFFDYIGAFSSLGSAAYRNRDSVEDISKIPYSALIGPRIKSTVRLRQLIRGIFHVDVTIEERIGTWLTFEKSDQMAVGKMGSSLGVDSFVGQRVYSINDKIRVQIKTRDLEQYRKFLPSGDLSEKLTDLIFFYLGHRFDFDVELALKANEAPAMKLGESGQLGWTSWVSPPERDGDEETYLTDARFAPLEQRRLQEEQK